MKKLRWSFIVISLLTLTSCGRPSAPKIRTDAPPITQGDSDTKVVLLAFGAPWCENCKRDLPEMNGLLQAEPESSRKQIKALLLVTSADNASEKPDQTVADNYKAALGLSFIAGADPWRWQTFAKYFGKKFRLPAAVLLNKNGELIKAFAPGTFVAQDVFHAIDESLRTQ